MPVPLEVFSDLHVTVDGEPVEVRAHGTEVMVDVPTIRAIRQLMASEPLRRQGRFGMARNLRDALQDAELTLDIRLTGESIARIGPGAQAGRLETLLNLDGIELHPVRSLRSVVRERPIWAMMAGGTLAFGIGWLLFRSCKL